MLVSQALLVILRLSSPCSFLAGWPKTCLTDRRDQGRDLWWIAGRILPIFRGAHKARHHPFSTFGAVLKRVKAISRLMRAVIDFVGKSRSCAS
jgi:hypothetical protein